MKHELIGSSLLFQGKYHCMSELLCFFFGFSCFSYVKLTTDFLVWLNPNQLNRRSAMQCNFPLWSKWVFSDRLFAAPRTLNGCGFSYKKMSTSVRVCTSERGRDICWWLYLLLVVDDLRFCSNAVLSDTKRLI